MLKLHLIILIQEWLSNSQLQWIVFQAVLAQTSFKERLISAAGMFGKQAALLNSKSYEGP
jgi:hypothetical protein